MIRILLATLAAATPCQSHQGLGRAWVRFGCAGFGVSTLRSSERLPRFAEQYSLEGQYRLAGGSVVMQGIKGIQGSDRGFSFVAGSVFTAFVRTAFVLTVSDWLNPDRRIERGRCRATLAPI
ncbi:MAG: hypothetical protein MUF49_21290 [Oculatellaceae cyanobacterium Prado106]|jgi:hypothetical protein|nr:hypothetical protein [Oculatellaceae cyanobacterium Prado106]